MGKAIKQIYRKAGLTPPKGKGIHTKKFHEMAVAIKRDNPSYPMKRCYKIVMGQLGVRKAVNPSHRRSINPKITEHIKAPENIWAHINRM